MPEFYQSQTVARPVYLDRAPLAQVLATILGAIAPHAATVRASYTVPSGRKAYGEVAWAHTRRVTAAAPVGYQESVVRLTPSGGVVSVLVEASQTNNTVGAQADQGTSGIALMLPGDLTELVTVDNSTGGTCAYVATLKATEFDL